MSADEHYAEAKKELEAAYRTPIDTGESGYHLGAAQVHATLALAYATSAHVEISKPDATVAADRPTHTHDGDEFVYDGIGKRQLDRLRALLTHSDRDRLTTWEVVEIAADELERVRRAAS